VPVLSIADLGVLRNVSLENEKVIITITPTYSGCPAMDMISMSIRMAMLENGIADFEIKSVLSPAWTTDWMSEEGKQKLKEFGIAPPIGKSFNQQFLEDIVVPCPHCGSEHTQLVSEFSSTACKAFYTCSDCKEPFDHFKCH
jgi:ring-1,2-phenylacetyl-CoA epoxidase subunit PaaD